MQKQKTSPKCDMAEYLSGFRTSPYFERPSDRPVVEGVSTLRGSWRDPRAREGENS